MGEPLAAVAVRTARVHDAPGIAALELACFAQPWSAAQIAAELRSAGGLALLATATPGEAGGDATVLGYALFRRVADEAELLRLAVLPGERHRGLARRLLAAGLDAVRAAGCAVAFLEVSERNEVAVALYEREGWRRDGRRPAYYPDGSAALLYRHEV